MEKEVGRREREREKERQQERQRIQRIFFFKKNLGEERRKEDVLGWSQVVRFFISQLPLHIFVLKKNYCYNQEIKSLSVGSG